MAEIAVADWEGEGLALLIGEAAVGTLPMVKSGEGCVGSAFPSSLLVAVASGGHFVCSELASSFSSGVGSSSIRRALLAFKYAKIMNKTEKTAALPRTTIVPKFEDIPSPSMRVDHNRRSD